MTGAMIFRLVLVGLVFLAWAALMFSTLFALRARAVRRHGGAFPGPGATLREMGAWLRAPEDRQTRRTLGFLTLCLFAMIAMNALLAAP